MCGLFLFWEYSCLYVLTMRKTWSVPIYIKWRGEAKSEEEPKQKLWSGLSNGKLITPGILTSLLKACLVRGPSGCLKLTRTVMCHKDHSGSWQRKLEMSESKRGVWEMPLGGTFVMFAVQKKKKKPTMIDLKMGRVISKMEMDEKRRKRKGKSRAKTRRKSYFFSFKGH